MLYTPKPKSFYRIMALGQYEGLGTVSCTEATWNLVTISSRHPFAWELRNMEDMQLPCIFPNLAEAEMTLIQFVDNELVSALVNRLDPMQFFRFLMKHRGRLGHLHLAKYWGNEEDWLKVVRGRAYAWAASRGRKLNRKEQGYIDLVVPDPPRPTTRF